MIACLKPQKAPLDFIRVCDLVRKALPEAHYLLVGDGVLREAVEREIEKRAPAAARASFGMATGHRSLAPGD